MEIDDVLNEVSQPQAVLIFQWGDKKYDDIIVWKWPQKFLYNIWNMLIMYFLNLFAYFVNRSSILTEFFKLWTILMMSET